MRMIRLIKTARWLVLFALMTAAPLFAQPGVFEASSTSGILDVDGITYLMGNTSSGDLVQLIWAGPDNTIDDPDSLGATTDDDSLIGTSHIGSGWPVNPDEGKFTATFTHDLLVAGTQVYVRAWNDSIVIPDSTEYGESLLYTIQNSSDSHDFGTWQIIDHTGVPVEFTAFTATASPGKVTLEWVTQSETENLGFHIYRSMTLNGQRTRLTHEMINGAINSSAQRNYSWTDRTVEQDRAYYYWVVDISSEGIATFHGPKSVRTLSAPKYYALDQNYPNPFNPSTSIHYMLKERGRVHLTIYNIRGQLIRDLVDSEQAVGEYTVVWDGLDNNGRVVPSGTYLYSISVNDFSYTRKMALTK